MNIIDKYGIKEVADVTIYELNEVGEIDKPVLFLDTLKVCEIEVATEEVKHYGGMGNSLIVDWSYIKNVTVKIEDALFSMKSLAVLCGGKISHDNKRIIKTETFRATGIEVPQKDEKVDEWNSVSGWSNKFISIDKKEYEKFYPRFYNSSGEEVEVFTIGELYYCTYYLKNKVFSVDLTSNNFPGYYCLVGETFIRSEATNSDELFYFIIPKAKLVSNLTLKLSTDNVSVFNFNFSAVKHRNFNLIELVKLRAETIEDDYSDLDFAILNKMKLGKDNLEIVLEKNKEEN